MIDHALDFFDGQDIGKDFLFRGFDNIYPDPLFVQDLFVEELQSVPVYFNGTPRMTFDQSIKVVFEVLFR